MSWFAYALGLLGRTGAAVAVGLALAGCSLKPPPDPNDPADAGTVRIEVIERNLRATSRAINERVARGEITDEKGREILAQTAEKLLRSVRLEKISPDSAWRYGDVYRAAGRWREARQAYEVALARAKQAKNEDRRVNDALRLAQACAQLGDVERAIELARSTFDARPVDKAPILMAVLYEIVEAGKGKGKDAELAKLLEDAVAQHQQVIVDPKTDAGRNFLAAKLHHLTRAFETAIALYESAGKRDEAEAARAALAQLLDNQRKL